MEKNALTTTVAILLILYALINLGAGYGQFVKARLVSGTTSLAADMGQWAGDEDGSKQVRARGMETSTILYGIAILILATGVLELAGSVGLFAGARWAVPLVITAVICGYLVEVQDIAEDGLGPGKLIFLAINTLAMIAIVKTRRSKTAVE